MIMRQHHSQFPGPGRRERNVVGTPMWPAYALRSIGLLFAVAAVLFLLGGLVQINPIWQWGPYHPYLSENGAQPDWYIGWLIGALRLMPNWELVIGGHTRDPQPFLGRRRVPAVRVRGDVRVAGARAPDHRRPPPPRPARPPPRPTHPHRDRRGVLQLGRDHLRGRLDRPHVLPPGISYTAQIHFWRAGIWVLPIIVFFVTRSVCRSLQRSGTHPLREWQGDLVGRREDGTLEVVAGSPDRIEPKPSEPPVGTVPGREA